MSGVLIWDLDCCRLAAFCSGIENPNAVSFVASVRLARVTPTHEIALHRQIRSTADTQGRIPAVGNFQDPACSENARPMPIRESRSTALSIVSHIRTRRTCMAAPSRHTFRETVHVRLSRSRNDQLDRGRRSKCSQQVDGGFPDAHSYEHLPHATECAGHPTCFGNRFPRRQLDVIWITLPGRAGSRRTRSRLLVEGLEQILVPALPALLPQQRLPAGSLSICSPVVGSRSGCLTGRC